MHRPLSTQQAYALLGMLLGTFPPAAIFTRMFGYGLSHWPQRYELGLLLLCLAMNVVCCLMGKVMGRVVGQTVELNQGRPGWARLLSVMLAAVLWGIVTGAVGGFVCFGIGAFIAPFFAVPVGVVAFTVFTLLHRPLAHGGMIDACYFWPLACGVALSTAAMILSVR